MHQNKKILYFCLCYIGIDLSKTTFWVNISTRPFFYKKMEGGKFFFKRGISISYFGEKKSNIDNKNLLYIQTNSEFRH